MNKAELIDAIHASADLSKGDAERALNAFIDVVQRTVSADEKVALPGFGTFSPTQRAERMARNPQTGEMVRVPAPRAPSSPLGRGSRPRWQGRSPSRGAGSQPACMP
ncbi:MAG: HU family DNA-binding protein [Acidimicrobiia bacterium]|nr:HU family DNA-binding protein [Acidimicrobiia bacterium]